MLISKIDFTNFGEEEREIEFIYHSMQWVFLLCQIKCYPILLIVIKIFKKYIKKRDKNEIAKFNFSFKFYKISKAKKIFRYTHTHTHTRVCVCRFKLISFTIFFFHFFFFFIKINWKRFNSKINWSLLTRFEIENHMDTQFESTCFFFYTHFYIKCLSYRNWSIYICKQTENRRI